MNKTMGKIKGILKGKKVTENQRVVTIGLLKSYRLFGQAVSYQSSEWYGLQGNIPLFDYLSWASTSASLEQPV